MLSSNRLDDRVKASTDFFKLFVDKDYSTELYALLEQTAASGPSLMNILFNIALGAVYCIPEIGNFVALGMATIWTVLQEVSKKESNTSELVTTFKKQIQAMVDRSINIYDSETLLAQYKHCSTYVVKYAADVRNLKKKPADAKLRTELRETIKLALDNLQQGIELSSKQSSAQSELYMYTLMATTRLLLLRDLVANGTSWDIPAASITSSYKPELKSCILNYTKWCVNTYTSGIDKVKAGVADDVNLFNRLQQYRNWMITNVFDVVSFWQYLDSTKFPKGVVISEKTRLLLSDTVGCPVNTPGGVNYDYYTATCTNLLANLATNKYYIFRGEHENLYLTKDEVKHRFVTISNGFRKNVNLQTITKDSTVTNPTAVNTEDKVGSSESEEKVTIRYDIIPKSIEMSIAGSIKCVDDINCASWDSGSLVKKCQAEFSWHRRMNQFKFPNIDHSKDYFMVTEAYAGGRSGNEARYNYVKNLPYNQNSASTLSQPYHKVQAIWSWGVNMDQNVRAAGTVDSAFVSFAPVELFMRNWIYYQAPAHAFDAVKYDYLNGSMEQEYFGPGMAALCLKTGNNATYNFMPTKWVSGKKIRYYIRFVVKSVGAGSYQIQTTTQVGVTTTVAVAAKEDASDVKVAGGTLCPIIIDGSTEVAINIINNGTVPLYIRSILLVKDKEVTTAA
ncbi:hypothetical protein SAMD00019534_075450 [Acytostelium subglobosum LB1]|uniref:hypothetical protein n=1 Tax=Acytostelium subglobosum LB1 TaxID=1410327 RepID=UPI000644A370|nr:hypothetical protein SAMD00019534_075450 [Acytostelium subglobosum LB1]GAM24370.1 hypothetical protein SAMD00019534_075450 [Acytostelium subglobosum LB1]|eukprot:XP_012752696.1 hypothetical protein SAMD00019534_075450 [Acytostelium subglobosum LB1]